MKRRYIYIIILLLAVFFFTKQSSIKELPLAIGEPLEIIIIKNPTQFEDGFYRILRQFLSVNIGPAPQSENILNVIELEQGSFKGILKRHQNLLFISRADTFSIKYTTDLFAKNQHIIFVNCRSNDDLKKNKKKIIELVSQIKQVEVKRQILKYKNQNNLDLHRTVKAHHSISMLLPKNFFLAFGDQNVTWLRNETPKIGQGILIANLDSNIAPLEPYVILSAAEDIIKKHILGPLENSYMILEDEAPMILDTIMLNNVSVIKVQSLWRMENDFMGGVFQLYYVPSDNNSPDRIIYTYVYAPGENKKIPLMHLESIIQTTDFL